MKFIADLHIHSHFSRATARNLDPEHLTLWAKKKGITLIGTGDFTHAGWIAELQNKTVEAENGLYRLKPDLEATIEKELPASCRKETRFLLSGEISCIYKKGDKTRKLHHLILMPDMDAALRLNKKLDRIGNITSDGRPILGLDSRDLLEIVLEVSERVFFIPAHIWTPWFSLFGSKSGFDTIEECFEDLTPHIHALETGLSSDPPMNRLLSAIDDYILVSNSDAHSPTKLGREANLFDTELDYDQIVQAMTTGSRFEGTIEFFPEEGKYHLDGHRKCQQRLYPKETRAYGNLCPSCGKPLTIGVLHRVEELSDRETPKLKKDFFSLIPLPEILSEIFDCGPATKKVGAVYEDLLLALGPELKILMHVPLKDIETAGGVLLSTAIARMRQGQVIREEGYDGEYGTIRLFEEGEKPELAGQTALFSLPKKKRAARKQGPPAERRTQKKRKSPSHAPQTRFSDPILDPLNSEQREAVRHKSGHLLIVAGPGTGKTMTLSHRIAHLIQSKQVSPGQVLALTFTNKAAREMSDRINRLLQKPTPGEEVWISTFHGFCLEILRHEGTKLDLPSPFQVCSETDVPILARQVISDSGGGRHVATMFIENLSRLKARSVIEDRPVGMSVLSAHDLLPYFQKYQKRLRDLGLLDLDDLEVETLKLFKDYPDVCQEYAKRFPRIFVDEYQDTNPVQVALLKTLVKAGSGEICAIGDPNQAIYGFRGADALGFHRFSEDYAGTKEIKLSKNYRSSQLILDASSALLGEEKPLEAMTKGGVPIRLAPCQTQAEEAEMIVEQVEKLIGGTTYFSLDSGRVSSHEEGENLSFGDMAVLFRINAQGEALEEAFKRAGIPFIRSGEKPLIHQYPAHMIWRFLQALRSPDNPFHLKAYLDLLDQDAIKGFFRGKGTEILRQCDPRTPVTGLIDQAVTLHGFDCSSKDSAQAVRRLREFAEASDRDLGSFLDRIALDRGIDHTGLLGDRVALMSLHAAKGLEWPVVFITGFEEGLLPCTLFGARDAEEEKRLFYVGMTRARSSLVISHAGRRMITGHVRHMKPSPFTRLIPEQFCVPLERTQWKRKPKHHQQLGLFSD
jgi:DNA helicase-2/ATP-dependent DNA helicase PcrA